MARWLERAAVAAWEFNDPMTRGYEMKEVQADEIRTFLGNKDTVTWVMATIEVWSRLWPSTVVGRRSYRNIRLLMEDTTRRGKIDFVPLITTDGYYYYGVVLSRMNLTIRQGSAYLSRRSAWLTTASSSDTITTSSAPTVA